MYQYIDVLYLRDTHEKKSLFNFKEFAPTHPEIIWGGSHQKSGCQGGILEVQEESSGHDVSFQKCLSMACPLSADAAWVLGLEGWIREGRLLFPK